MRNFEVSEWFPVEPDKIYRTWLDAGGHSRMTGGEADIAPENGYEFTAWNGYITGRIVELVPEWKIVMKWRGSEFDDTEADSTVTVELEDEKDGTRLTLTHENIPDGKPDYEQGWKDHYFEPMKEYVRG